jgi:hypothetical protein
VWNTGGPRFHKEIDMDLHQVIVFDSVLLTLVTLNVIPFLISFVTNEVTRKGVKEGLLFIISGLAAWVDEVAAEGGVTSFDDIAVTWTGVFLGSAGFFFAWQRRTVSPPLERAGLSVGAPKT